MQQSKTLDVYYHGRLVGTLAETPDKRIAFQYSDEWQKNGFSISPFSLPLGSDVFIPNERSLDRFGGLFGVFADSLPDSWGELLLDNHLASLGIKKGDVSILDRLAYVGRNGMGALEYFPSKESNFDFNGLGLDYDFLAKECEKLLSSKTSDQLDVLYKMGGSSGGTRPKVLLSEKDKEWIIKFPAKNDPSNSGKCEYDYSLCAKECGITMTQTAIVESKVCEGYFKTERFDRVNAEKVFCESFAGLLEADYRAPSCDYETFFKLLRVLTKDSKPDKEQLFRIMCFNVFAFNRDDHTKNFSLIYSESKGWEFAPAYDITYSNTYWGEHTTSVNGKGKDITSEDLIIVGEKAGLKKNNCREIIEEIKDKTISLEKYFDLTKNKKHSHRPFKESVRELSK